MHLQQAIKNTFVQLNESISQLSNEQYIKPSNVLFNATIGQHVRHIIELFQCLESGYADNTVNYEERKRDVTIENNKELALQLLQEVYTKLDRPNKELVLHASYDEHSEQPVSIPTNYHREVAYNLEHTIHHMALIRVGIAEVSDITLPDEFGVASSTVKHRKYVHSDVHSH